MKNAFIGWTDTAGLYFPPDFDPSKLVSEKKYNKEKFKDKKKEPKMMNIRMMMPFSMICDTCGNFSYIGTKFNSRVERLKNEAYFGCSIYRFYGKCQHCGSHFTFKTDPATADYVMEAGGRRNYEAWKDAEGAEESVAKTREEEAEFDNMKALEQASESAAAEMQIADALEELQQLNKRTRNHDEAVLNAIDFLYKKHAAESEPVDDDNFEDELEAYRNERVANKRCKLNEEIDDQDSAAAESTASSSSAPSAASSDERREKSAVSSDKARTKLDPFACIVSRPKMAPPPPPPIKRAEIKPDPPAPSGSLLAGYDSESSGD